MNTFEKDGQYIAHTYARFPLQIVSGKGSILTDSEGKEYIDLGTGIAVNTFGTADEEWIQAVTEQLKKFSHTSNLFYSSPCADLAEELCRRTGLKKVFFSNSGAEANECAIKAARGFAAQKWGQDRYTIITLQNSFHGRTITTLAATGQDVFHQDFTPLTEGFVSVPANDIQAVRDAVKEHNAIAVMFETVQGEGGVLPLEESFVAGLVQLREETEILLISDEVQTGNGRTGQLYGYMNYDMLPDIVTTAKGLGGGLPIGATLLGDRVESVYQPGSHGSTFGGNPAVCAGALNVIRRIDESLLGDVRAKSQYIFDQLSQAEGVKSVSGLGLMIGIEPVGDAKAILAKCRERGVIALTAKNKVRLLPPLNIPMDLLQQAVDVLKDVFAQCGKGE
ncbi:MAG: acetylornithine/succinylornithine family transaminase [Clostridia bacterium]|nr:acetylornithine/succinylornithine family transaminase [Clostridia bacterium]